LEELHHLGRQAEQKRDWATAERCWRAILSMDSELWWAHTGLATALCEQDQYEEAKHAIERQLDSSPQVVELWIHRARMAGNSESLDSARQKWREVCLRFPQNPAGFSGQVEFEFHKCNFEKSIDYCNEYLHLFPDDFWLNFFKAKLCQISGEHSECLAVINKLIDKDPNNHDLHIIKNDTLGRINQSNIITTGVEIPLEDSHTQTDDIAPNESFDDREFFLQFESLGANCEFGFVQRRHNAEPIGLLRWSSITPKQLVYALDNKFVGLGDEDYLEIFEGWNYQWDARDDRYFTYHSYIGILEANKAQAAEIVRKRLSFMRKKLVRDIEEGEKIFVYKEWNFRISDNEIHSISRALRRINRSNKLLVVKLFDQNHAPGEVVMVNNYLAIGYLEVDAASASLEHVPIESWRKICSTVAHNFSAASLINVEELADLEGPHSRSPELPFGEPVSENTGQLHDLGRQAEQRRDWNEAARIWRRFIAFDPNKWWSYTALANALREQRLWEEADSALLDGQTRCPTEQAVFFDYARLAEMRRDWTEAERRWVVAGEHFPDHWASYIGKATVQHELGQVDESSQILAEANARFPDNTGMLHDLGRLAERQRNFAEAERIWRQFLALDQDKWWAYTALASALREQSQWDAADTVLTEGQLRCPNEPPVFFEHARLAEARRNWDEAARRWEVARSHFPTHVATFTGQAAAMRELGKLDESEGLMAAASAQFPNNTDLLHDLGRLAERRRNWSEAAGIWRRFIALDPNKWWSYTALAGALREQQLWDAGEAVLVEGQERCPGEQPVFFDHARFAEMRRNWEEAARRWELAGARFPDHWASYTGRAAALRELGRLDESEGLLAEAVARFPGNTELLHDLGRMAERRRDWPEAERVWRQLIALDRQKWWAYTALAVALREQGDWDGADAALTEGQSCLPNEPALFFDHARLAEMRCDWAEAMHRWDTARARFPDNWTGYSGGARALSELKRFEDADQLLTECLVRFPVEQNILFEYARLAEARSDWNEALRRWETMRERLPTQYAGYRGAAAALRELNRPEDAGRLLSEAVEKFPGNGDPLHDLARLAEHQRDWEAAAGHWAELRQNAPDNPGIYVNNARALFEAWQDKDAESLIDDARSRFPEDRAIFQAWAEFAARRGNMAAATARWREFRDRFPDEPIGYVRGAHTYFQAGHNHEADALIAEGLERLPKSVEIAVCRAEITAYRRNWLESARQWQEVRRQFPTFSRAYVEEARLRSEAEDKPAARAVLDAARRDFPDDASIAFTWLRLAATTAAPREVLEKWQEVHAAFGHLVDCYVVGGEALRQAGLSDQCEEILSEGMRKFPASSEVAQLWAEAGYLTSDPEATAMRYIALLPSFESNHKFVFGALRAFAASERKDAFDAANAVALRRWPNDFELLRLRVQFMFQRDDADETFSTWETVAKDHRVRFDFKNYFASEILKAYPLDSRSHSAIDFLLREPDLGTQDWRPALSRAFPHGDPRDRTSYIREFLAAASQEEFSLPCVLALKTAANVDLTASDISAGISLSAKGGRLLLLVSIFRSSYFLNAKHPDRLRMLVQTLRTDWLNRVRHLSFNGEADFKEVLGYLLLGFAYDVSVFHLMAGHVKDRLGKRLKGWSGTISRVEDVVRSIVSGVAARKSQQKTASSRPARRRLKIAVCVSGQMRGFREAVPTWSRLALDEHEPHYFVHTWEDLGLNWRRTLILDGNNPVFRRTIHSALGREIIMTKYPHLYAAMRQLEAEAKSIDREALIGVFGTDRIVIENDQVPPYLGRSNAWKMYYKIEQANKMAEASGIKFDLMIRIRPDIVIHPSNPPDWRAIQKSSDRDQIVFTEFGTIFEHPTSDFPIVGDKFYAGTPELMKVVCGAHSFANKVNEESKYLDMPSGYHPHTTLAFTAFYNGVVIQSVPELVFGPLINAAPLDPRIAVDAVRKDIGQRELDDIDRNLLRELEQQVGDLERRALEKQAA
jgi:tetratricopeptide (TPR) repeat protein